MSSRKQSVRKSVKRKPYSNSEVTNTEETMSQGDEHARLLESVTGLMEKMPLEEEEVSSVSMEQEGGGEGEDAASTGVDKLAAAEYLGLWNGNRKKWSFKKKTQYWLLQNMYDKKKVSKSNFKLMLKYLDGLRGNQRSLAKKRAEEVMALSEEDKDQVPELKVKHKRAVQVVRALGKIQ